MVSGDPDDGFKYAQVGYKYFHSSASPSFFWQYLKCFQCTVHGATWGDPSLTTNYNFKVFRSPSDGHLHMNVDYQNPPVGTPETNFDPLDPDADWPNMNAQWYAESGNWGDDIPGLSRGKTNFDNTRVKNPDATWVDVLDYNQFGVNVWACWDFERVAN